MALSVLLTRSTGETELHRKARFRFQSRYGGAPSPTEPTASCAVVEALDTDAKGFITVADLRRFFGTMGSLAQLADQVQCRFRVLSPSHALQDVTALMFRYDKSQKGHILYTDFLDELVARRSQKGPEDVLLASSLGLSWASSQ